MVRDASATLGLDNIPVMHTNDAKMALGSHCDRHANIGAGYIGFEGFRRILNHPELAGKPSSSRLPSTNRVTTFET